jgi:hypothetical protein
MPRGKPSKGWLREKEIVKTMGVKPLVMFGEPLIYSIKFSLGERRLPVQFFRDRQWRSRIRCWFSSHFGFYTPVVVLVKFYVSYQPLKTLKPLTDAQVASESIPAVHSWELADLEMSYLEALKFSLLTSYRQIVKLDMCKYYSKNPRTVMQILPWSHYVDLLDNYPDQTKSESLDKDGKRKGVQPKRKGHDADNEVRKKAVGRPRGSTLKRSSVNDRALCIPPPETLCEPYAS